MLGSPSRALVVGLVILVAAAVGLSAALASTSIPREFVSV